MQKYRLFNIIAHIFWWLIAIPIVFFLIAAISLYIPAVQDYAVEKATNSLAANTGYEVSVERVRLHFPLTLSVQGLTASQAGEKLVEANSLNLHLRVLPLFRAQADIASAEIQDAYIDTQDLVGGAHVRGTLGTLYAKPLPQEQAAALRVGWETQRVRLRTALLRDADLTVCLSDTVLDDTITEKKPWTVDCGAVKLQNVRVKVSMAANVPSLETDSVRPAQMWIAADIGKARLQNAHFDTGHSDYAFQGLKLEGSNVAYRASGTDGLWTRRAQMTPIPEDRQPTPLDTLRSWWDYTDNIKELAAWNPFNTPSTGKLDTENIVLTDISLGIDGLRYDADGRLRMNLKNATLREKNSSFSIDDLSGEVYLDSERIRLPQAQLHTPYSTIAIGGDIPWTSLTEPLGNLRFDIDATLGWQDVVNLSRGYVDTSLMKHYPHLPLRIKGNFNGNIQHLQFRNVLLQMPDMLSANATGRIDYLTTRPQGDITFNATTGSRLPSLYRQLLPDVSKTVNLPARMTAKGRVKFQGDDYTFTTEIGAGNGTALAKGHVNTSSEAFNVKLNAHNFPLYKFLPGYELSSFTGTLSANGNSFDVFRRGAKLNATADIHRFAYAGYDLSGIGLNASLAGGKALINFNAQNPNIEGSGSLEALLSELPHYSGMLNADFTKIDFRGLGLTEDTLSAGAQFRAHFNLKDDFSEIQANGFIENIFMITPDRGFNTDDLAFGFSTSADTTTAHAESGDLILRLGTKGNISRLAPRLSSLADVAMKQWEQKELDQEALKRELPPMELFLTAGQHNPVSSFLRFQGYSFNTARIDLHAHPETGLSGMARVGAITAGSLLIDTVHFNILQDTTGVQLDGFVRNYTKKNPNKFDARLHGYLLSKGAGIEAKFYDSDGEKGIDLGVRADLIEEGINVVLYPEHPVLAYRNFRINKDNFIFLGNNQQIRANVDLLADDGTGLQIYSAGAENDSVNDITVSVNNINLAELSNVLPYMPKLAGTLTGDFHIYDNHKEISAMGSVEANEFAYEGTRLGRLGADVIYLPKSADEHYASAYISSNGQEVMEAEGTYFTTDDTFKGDAHLHDFPLGLINAFLEGTDMALDGHGGGDLTIQGALDKPVINGELLLDSAHIFSDVYGFRFKMDKKPIAFEDSRIVFKDYNLRSTGNEPLKLNGSIDMSDLSRINLDLAMNAKNFELINTKQTRKSMVFGKVITDFTGTVKGALSNLSVRGKLDILDKTDVTYILKDSPLTIDNRLDDLVKFTSFTDSVEEEEIVEDTPMNFDLSLGINVSDAAHFHCYLSEDGQSYANFDGGGTLTLRLTQQGDMRLSGKLTAQGGEMKYELPIIPLRTFKLVEGSTIEFTGDPMNPILNIQANERMKVLVTENEQQRAVAFDVGVAISKPLDQMGLEFTIDAPEDLSIQNQLAAMTAEQRNKAAVAMMATGMYLTDSGAQTSGFKANNALNAFLQNEIQNIAGNALKTIDVSVGVETGTSLVGTQTTDYSFQFAKRFWDDRIRVIIGGRVSAGKNADNRAESIINNVSVEYKINQGATHYLRIFYDRDQQDPLEGQLTNTGVGYSVRRKADKFTDLFLFWK